MERGWVWLPIAAGLALWLMAFRANCKSPLKVAIIWAMVAWLAWGWAFSTDNIAATYAALTLSGCAGVAVLGARRPGAFAWNFVVAGLLAILLLSLAEGAVTGAIVQLDTIRTFFLCGLLGTVVLNFLPTRLFPAAISFALGSGLTLGSTTGLVASDTGWQRATAQTAILCVPWLAAWAFRRSPTDVSPANRLWFDFRDRFGAIWALRVMEQFNRSATNNGSPQRLTWRGMIAPDDSDWERLRALVSRFGMSERQKPGLVMPAPEPTPLRPGD